MKNLFIFAALIISLPLFAQERPLSKKELVKMTIEQESVSEEIIEKWNELFDRQHLKRDRYKHRMNWRDLFPIQSSKVHHIKGKRIYYGLAEKEYRYDIIEDAESNKLIVHVKIHFWPSKTYLKRMNRFISQGKENNSYPDLETLMARVDKNVLKTQEIWNDQVPEGVEFKFERVEDPKIAHYSVELRTKLGVMYDRYTLAPAYYDSLSHEVGHMMGLDDEYTSVTTNVLQVYSILESITKRHPGRHKDASDYQDSRCNLESIMCLRYTVYPYHLNHILGRIKL